MKIIRVFPYVPGGLLLLLILWLDLNAIEIMFGSQGRAGVVGVFILLEGMLIAWLHFMCERAVDCERGIERSISLFYLTFLVMGVCSVATFAVRDGVEIGIDMGILRGFFWLLFAVLVLVGGRLVLYLFKIIQGREPGVPKGKASPSIPLYGRAGYGSK